jgi:dTDP-4-dehydrorhamnose 3,5-epimerase
MARPLIGPPTYGKHVAAQHKCDEFYHPEADGGICILDDTLGIDWKIPTEHANLSEKDTKHAMLKNFDSTFDINKCI